MQVQAIETIVPRGKQANAADRTVGGRMAVLRKSRGLSQAALGQAIGVTFQQVQKYEKGVNRIGASRLIEAARVLEVSVAELIGDEHDRSEHGTSEIMPSLLLDGAIDLLRLYSSITFPSDRRDMLSAMLIFSKHLPKGGA